MLTIKLALILAAILLMRITLDLRLIPIVITRRMWTMLFSRQFLYAVLFAWVLSILFRDGAREHKTTAA